MRVLGIEIAGSNVQMILLKGTAKIFTIDILSPSKLPLPPDPEEVNRLLALKKQVYDLLKSNSVESIGIIRADPGSSPLRAKVECVIQLAAADASVPCKLVAGGEPALSLPKGISRGAPSNSKQNSPVKPRVLCGESVSEPWIPESKLPPISKNPINSIVRKILLTTPEFPRFYADVVMATGPNSNEAKILRLPTIKKLAKRKCHVEHSHVHSYQSHWSPLRLPGSPRRAILLLPPAHDSRRSHSAAHRVCIPSRRSRAKSPSRPR